MFLPIINPLMRSSPLVLLLDGVLGGGGGGRQRATRHYTGYLQEREVCQALNTGRGCVICDTLKQLTPHTDPYGAGSGATLTPLAVGFYTRDGVEPGRDAACWAGERHGRAEDEN